MAQRTPAKPTSRLRSLSLSLSMTFAALFVKRGVGSLHWPVFASSTARFAAAAESAAGGCLGACAAQSEAIASQTSASAKAEWKGLDIKMSERQRHLPNHTSVRS